MRWTDIAIVLGGLVAGLISGTIGIGGGLVFVPLLTTAFGFHQPIAQGTSLAAIVPTAAVGGVTHIRLGNVLVEEALWMGGGGVVGSIVGALVALDVPSTLLARGFGVFLLFSAYRLVAQARRPKTTPESS